MIIALLVWLGFNSLVLRALLYRDWRHRRRRSRCQAGETCPHITEEELKDFLAYVEARNRLSQRLTADNRRQDARGARPGPQHERRADTGSAARSPLRRDN